MANTGLEKLNLPDSDASEICSTSPNEMEFDILKNSFTI